jgi:hypothetical protein
VLDDVCLPSDDLKGSKLNLGYLVFDDDLLLKFSDGVIRSQLENILWICQVQPHQLLLVLYHRGLVDSRALAWQRNFEISGLILLSNNSATRGDLALLKHPDPLPPGS